MNDCTPRWMTIALAEKGQAEIAGPKANPRIVEYAAATSLKATTDEVPWCSSFVNWVMGQAGISGTGSAAARSWLDWGQALDGPKIGAVVVFSRGDDPAAGHVGYVYGEGITTLDVLGGNQHDMVGVSRYPKEKVLGYRWPIREEK